MAIAPFYWERARAEAPIHLQLRLTERPGPRRDQSIVGGKIVTIFRDDTHCLKRGARISFRIDWYDGSAPRDEDAVPMPGRQRLALDIAWLKAAQCLEAYLAPAWKDGREDPDGGHELVRDQATALAEATAVPVNPVEGKGYGVFVTDAVLRRVASPGPPARSWWSRWLG
jgi:hypothetical protein